MAANNLLNQSMDSAVKHYSSLFKLPPHRRTLILSALTCMTAGLVSSIALFSYPQGLLNGLFLGVALFLVNLLLDFFTSTVILRQDRIYDLRRTAALSLYCWFTWIFFILVGALVSLFLGSVWLVRLNLLGFSAVLILRLIVFGSTSFADDKRFIAASVIQPIFSVILFLLALTRIDSAVCLFVAFSTTVSIISALAFIFAINRVGKRMLGLPSLSLLKAFLLNWIVDQNGPFEELLEKLGETQNVEASVLKFGSSEAKAVIVVPSVHPGPFKNVGSSLLPSMIKSALEKKLNCVACVPHGLLGHEYDLASQFQSQRVVDTVVKAADFEISDGKATPLIEVSNGLATATCQILGRTAFLSFTLAPKTTEDLPQELSTFIRQETEKRGLNCFVVVNAHNSIDGVVNVEEALGSLESVATACLDKAVTLKSLPFEVGAATICPKEFGLKEGMGPGGITVVVVKVGEQRAAYVVFDGNNMVSGLREKILSALRSIGINKGEVFTTDTHSVSAVILNKRGYHPVGEAMQHETLLKHVKDTTLAALSGLKSVKVACNKITVHNVKVIGGKQLEALCLLIDKALQRTKRIIIPLCASVGLLLMLILTYV